MRKKVTGRGMPAGEGWFDLEERASVEVTSEDPGHPVDGALHALADGDGGWRASTSGEQVIRLCFDEPTAVRTIDVRFDELGRNRTQEFLLRWSTDGGRSYRDIVRQQYTFSPPGTTCQAERYTVAIDGMTTLELRITPDISGGEAVASLSRLRLA